MPTSLCWPCPLIPTPCPEFEYPVPALVSNGFQQLVGLVVINPQRMRRRVTVVVLCVCVCVCLLPRNLLHTSFICQICIVVRFFVMFSRFLSYSFR